MSLVDAHRDAGWPVASGMRALWPGVSLTAAMMLAASPGAGLGLPVASFVPVAVVFFWRIRQGGALPMAVVAACGLLLDVLSAGPLGYWALVSLVAGQLATTVGEFANGGWVARTVMLVACLVVAGGVQAGVAMAFGAAVPGVVETALAMAVVVGVYPALAWVLGLGALRPMGDAVVFEPQGRT